MVLLATATVNLFTKSIATVSGIAFAIAFFIVFTVSERINLRRHAVTAKEMKDHFQLEHQDTVDRESVAIRPGGVIVTMRDAANPLALKWTLGAPTPMSGMLWSSVSGSWARADRNI